jgi:hypothetical protein
MINNSFMPVCSVIFLLYGNMLPAVNEHKGQWSMLGHNEHILEVSVL